MPQQIFNFFFQKSPIIDYSICDNPILKGPVNSKSDPEMVKMFFNHIIISKKFSILNFELIQSDKKNRFFSRFLERKLRKFVEKEKRLPQENLLKIIAKYEKSVKVIKQSFV